MQHHISISKMLFFIKGYRTVIVDWVLYDGMKGLIRPGN